jgi:hypothetical protein
MYGSKPCCDCENFDWVYMMRKEIQRIESDFN